ncbi:MAG: S41 family peptidase [Candidatus Harrisonbacteria bacterium]|nr:S41 family peptidase [Candidatus Harrisonbacteria bacterium]
MRKLLQGMMRHRAGRGAFAALIVVGLAYGSFWLGTTRPQTLVIKNVSGIENDPKATADFTVFWEAWKRIKDEALKGTELTGQAMLYGAVGGLVKSLDDPNSVFFPPEDAQKFEEDVAGNFGGIGAEIGLKDEQIVVIAPLKDSPAEIAGIRSGDGILKVDDKSTAGMRVNDAVKIIRGPKGTPVVLSMFRSGWDKPRDISIVRDTIMVPTLDWKTIDGGIGYIRIMNFNENAPQLFARAARELTGAGVRGVIVDVRDDPGGFLDVAVTLAGWFMKPDSLVVTEEFRADAATPKIEFRSRGAGTFKDVPIVALLNQGSASAAEILAGALRDNRGAVLVGEKSFGKGTVQELKRLHDGSSMKLTIAHWLLPNGDQIDKNGITPSVEVKISDEDAKNKKDTQLEKAKEVMKGLLEKAVANR